jgi:NAD(P)-dependent dehydrogenase (short-subunit alcohol dehydrogenase family)
MKTAIEAITKDMGLPALGELREGRIRVHALSPGVIHTESYEKDMGVDGAAAYTPTEQKAASA